MKRYLILILFSVIPLIGLAAQPGCYQCHNKGADLSFVLEPVNTCFIAPEFTSWVVTVCEKKVADKGRSIMHIDMGGGQYKVMHSRRKYDYGAKLNKLSSANNTNNPRLLYDPGRHNQ